MANITVDINFLTDEQRKLILYQIVDKLENIQKRNKDIYRNRDFFPEGGWKVLLLKENFEIDIEHLTECWISEILKKLINSLDDLDGEDFFGSEGWRHYLLGE